MEEKPREPKDLEAARNGMMSPWKKEQSLKNLECSFISMAHTPLWTIDNVLSMFSYYFRFREYDRKTIWILNEEGEYEAKDLSWFADECQSIDYFVLMRKPILDIWKLLGYEFLRCGGLLLPSSLLSTKTKYLLNEKTNTIS
jgi:hypothetical protein